MTETNQQGQAQLPIYTVIDPLAFLKNGMFRQDDFLPAIENHDWGQYAGKRVLVRGCGSAPIPPWAYMAIASRLTGIAGSVRYGNEHDNVVIWRAKKT